MAYAQDYHAVGIDAVADDVGAGNRALAELRSGNKPATSLTQHFPAAVVQLAEKQSFPLAPGFFSPAQQARRQYTRVVQDQQITRSKKIGKVMESMVRQTCILPANQQQPGLIALGTGFLSDQVSGQ